MTVLLVGEWGGGARWPAGGSHVAAASPRNLEACDRAEEESIRLGHTSQA